MKILVHDYAGHPFQAELSRELARRGHHVVHAWFGADKGPKGNLSNQSGDASTLKFIPIGTNIAYSKTNLLKRRKGDLEYGRQLSGLIRATSPDIVISGNTPTESQEFAVKTCGISKIPFIYWCQDFYSIAASQILEKKLPIFGNAIGAYYRYLECRQMMRSAKIVHITESFLEQTDKWNIPRTKVEIIPNWGALNEIRVLDRNTEWADECCLKKGTRYIYTGTLALKHNPHFMMELSQNIEKSEEVVVVCSGVGASFLASEKKRGLPNLTVMGLQPFQAFDQVLGSADVLLAVIEKDAGKYSVPSKILSYLCAGKPIVLAAPKENLAAQIVNSTGAGMVVDPEDAKGFVEASLHFGRDNAAARLAGQRGRSYAEENFDISEVTMKFENVFELAVEKTA